MGRHKKVSSNIKIPSLDSIPKNPFESWSSKKIDTHDFEIDTCCSNNKNTIDWFYGEEGAWCRNM